MSQKSSSLCRSCPAPSVEVKLSLIADSKTVAVGKHFLLVQSRIMASLLPFSLKNSVLGIRRVYACQEVCLRAF